MKKIACSTVLFAVVVALWVSLFGQFRYNEQILFPTQTYEVYTLTDNVAGGFSTCELDRKDSVITATVNLRSGMAYPFAGIGFNLLSVNKRPAISFFDFSQFDSIEVDVETGRMRDVSVRIMADDPVYSKAGEYLSYRPLIKALPVGKNSPKASLYDFKVTERWLAVQGLESDDGQKHLDRGAMLEVYNGEGALRGIPDDIVLRSIRLWGENRNFISLMYVMLGLIVAIWILSVIYFRRTSASSMQSREAAAAAVKKRMAAAADLLQNSDRSLAEIALAVGEKNQTSLVKNFARIYKKSPLEYRRKK